MKKNMYLFFSLALFMFSCGKDDSPKVTPEEENEAPVITEQSFEFYETFTTKNIGAVTATDPDGDSLTFSIETNDNDLFVITSEGVLGLSGEKVLDFETKTEHTITISVSDGTNEVSAKVTVIVLNVIDTLAENGDSFVTTWRTTEDGESITIGLPVGLAYDFMIDWGDGTIENISKDEDIEHSYATAGDHVVAIENFPGIEMIGLSSAPKLISLDQWGNSKWEHLIQAFAGCENMVYKATDVPDLSQVSSLFAMFKNAKQFNGDIGNWDMDNVTSINSMFDGASSFNGNIGQWNTANVTNMASVFYGASSFNQDIGMWVVSSVEITASMFEGASSFNQDIGTWNVSSVEQMNGMFFAASSFNGDIGQWNTEKVANMSGMFTGASSFDQDLGGWNIGSITNMENMLDNSGMSITSINNTVIGWSNFVENNEGPYDIICGMEGLEVCTEISAGLIALC
ncbi:MAG: BspA family leucine-rich repeat surface protein [Bacteroidota bacterium]